MINIAEKNTNAEAKGNDITVLSIREVKHQTIRKGETNINNIEEADHKQKRKKENRKSMNIQLKMFQQTRATMAQYPCKHQCLCYGCYREWSLSRGSPSILDSSIYVY